LRRGFKAQCENGAAAARKALKLGPDDRLSPWDYADHLDVVVLDFHALGLSSDAVRQLISIDGDSWSAMTLKDGETHAIVVNPAHHDNRQPNDLMHEIAHIELNHVPARVEVSKSGLMLLSDYSDEQEQEADWYAAALLLPRCGLLRLRGLGKSSAEIASFYGVSKALCDWRLRMTGVDVQMRRAVAR